MSTEPRSQAWRDAWRTPRLYSLRLDRALSQYELAKASGVHRSVIVRLEAGASARPPTIRKIAAALGVEPNDLTLPYEDDNDV